MGKSSMNGLKSKVDISIKTNMTRARGGHNGLPVYWVDVMIQVGRECALEQ